MTRFAIQPADHAGYEGLRLSDAQARVETVFLPGLAMLGASLRHRGEELLGRTDNLPRYASEGSTLGIPLLHPWANRLAGFRYEIARRPVELDPASPLLHLDGNGLPIHGVVGPRLPWTLLQQDASDAEAVLRARLDYSTPELLSVFPFPHELEQHVRLAADGLTFATTLTATAAAAVPVSFGYHPYVTLPAVARAEWRVEVPALRRLVLDDRAIPTGAVEGWPGLEGALDRDYDDGFAGVPAGAVFAIQGGGRRIEVSFLEGYPYAQLYAPRGADFICIEPMTAPTNALASGRSLRLVEPGSSFRAAFRIAVLAA